MNETISRLKHEWDIVTEIKKVVQLTKRGQNFVGLCPFHSEKTPSFYVSPGKKIFHCFGCGENGDVISFVMKHDHLSFKEVVLEKAKEFNIPHQFSQNESESSSLDKLRAFLNSLQLQYVHWLKQNQDPMAYLQDRGLSNADMAMFGLGYAPESRVQQAWLKDNGWLEICKDTGLFKDDGYPLLQQRLIFPIHNSRGIIVGFSGRIINDSQLAKYINSPESAVFSKKKILYATHLAKSAIKNAQSCVVVEGYMDAISMHKRGINNVVGVMGTALTDGHAKELAKYTDNVTLLFDSDKAGQAAIVKSLDALLLNNLVVRVASINEKDPADFLEKNNSDVLNSVLDTAPIYMDFFIHKLIESGALDDPQKKSKGVMFLCEHLSKEKNKVIKDDYKRIISDKFSVSINVIESYLAPKSSSGYQPKIEIKTNSKFKKAEEVVGYLLVTDLEFRRKNLNDLQDLIPFLSVKEIFKQFEKSDAIDYEIINEIRDSEIRNFLVSLIIKFTELNISFKQTEMEEYKQILNQTKVESRIAEIRSLLADVQGNQEKELLIELSRLIKKIK